MPKETILVVDDEKEIADLVALYLQNEGFRVCKAYDAGGALDREFGVRVRRVPVDGGWQYFCE